MDLAGGRFTLEDGVQWSILHPENEQRPVEEMQRLFERLGIEPQRQALEPHAHDWTIIRIGGNQPARLPHPNHLQFEWAGNPEGYRIEVTPEGIEIIGTTPRSAFYGIQTLAQLLRDEGGWRSPAIVIEDYPTMSFRGAHWFPSASGVPFHRNVIERLMARYKLNTAIIQCEAARWDSHPEIAADNSIRKDDLRGLVELCRQLFIEPVPLINVPGHAEWIFRHGHNLEFAEDPQTPYAYCVNHPKSHAFIEDILGEVLEVFEPQTVHMGHDEVTMRGRFPNPECPRCHDQSVTELVLAHAHRMHAWLAERDIGMMIWGDMLLSKDDAPDAAHAPDAESARQRREGLPQDVIICDWHYRPVPGFPSLELFHSHGLRTMASTWYEPLNVYHFSQAARDTGSLGLLQTTWAGFFPDESVLKDRGARQFAAFILAAEYAWSGRMERPNELPYDFALEFERSYWGRDSAERPGALVDLSAAARSQADGLTPAVEAEAPPAGEQRFGEVLFHVPVEGLAVVGAGRLAPDGAMPQLEMKLDRLARDILLLNASANLPPGTTVAVATVEYEDGTEAELELVAGSTTAGWNDTSSIVGLPVAWSGQTRGGPEVALRITRLANPHPDRRIAHIRLTPSESAGWLAIAGVTLLD